MFVEVLLDIVLVGVGDGDVFVAKDDAEAVYLFDLGHVDDVRAMGAQELGTGQIVFEFLHTHKRHDALSVSEMDADIVLEAFDEEDVVEGDALQLVFALDIHEAVGGETGTSPLGSLSNFPRCHFALLMSIKSGAKIVIFLRKLSALTLIFHLSR